MHDLVSRELSGHPQKTQKHKETTANGLSEGGNKKTSAREGEGRRMGRDEKRDLQEQMGTGQTCAPAARWLFITQVDLIFHPMQKSHSAPQVQHGLI